MSAKPKPWTDVEIQIIKDSYPVVGIKGTSDLLPGRTYNAVRAKAQEMQVQTPHEVRRQIAKAAAFRANEEIKKRKQFEAERAASFTEYEQAADIFQVGFRIACKLGVLQQYVKGAA